jgi:predicted hydrolase (HD superfamily)
MRQRGWPEEIIYAVLCHADYLELERKTPMDRAIYAVDELTGLVIAVLCEPSVQPNPSHPEEIRPRQSTPL